MIFTRSIPPEQFKQYESYKPYLRKDFEYCCAYCLRPETNFGGEACGEIDHLCPQSVDEGLVCEYTNLYWSCRECNSNKGRIWPSAEEMAVGKGFVDPCNDDLLEHYIFEDTGKITTLSSLGEYSVDAMLLWRDSLVNWRRDSIEAFKEIIRIEALLQNPTISVEVREAYRHVLNGYKKAISPPIFSRARRRDRPTPKSTSTAIKNSRPKKNRTS